MHLFYQFINSTSIEWQDHLVSIYYLIGSGVAKAIPRSRTAMKIISRKFNFALSHGFNIMITQIITHLKPRRILMFSI